MKKLILAVLSSALISPSVSSQPIIEGTPAQLESYLNKVRKEVILNASASREVSADRAVVTLTVSSEADKLASALKDNAKVRANMRKQLLASGFTVEDIKESSFSSTPEYGFFGDEPKSYRVNNVITVRVDSNQELINIASLVDKDKSIRYVSTKLDFEDNGKLEAQLRDEALDNLKDKLAVYRKAIAVDLKPVSFGESFYNTGEKPSPNRARVSKLSSYSGPYEEMATLGTSKFTYQVSVTYQVNPY